MIALVGYLAVLAGVGGGIALSYRGWRATRTGDAASLRTPVLVILAAGVVSFVALEAAIIGHDFSIEYVANNTSRSTPFERWRGFSNQEVSSFSRFRSPTTG